MLSIPCKFNFSVSCPFQISDIGYCEVTTFSDNFHDGWFLDNAIECPSLIKKSVYRRRREFFFGRFCAITALRKIQPEFSGNIPILHDRRPGFPPTISGSITHCDVFTAAICQPLVLGTIGIDAEKIMQNDQAIEICDLVVTNQEIKQSGLSHFDFSTNLSLIFSAKESVFKALYPQVRQVFDFYAVKLVEIDETTQIFSFALQQELSQNWSYGKVIKVHFRIAHKHVLTLAVA